MHHAFVNRRYHNAACDGHQDVNLAMAFHDRDHERDLSQLPELRSRVRRHVHTLIQSLPPQQSEAYMEAMQKCPALVQHETDPLQYVRQVKYKLLEGAQRLCLYWTERKNMFGSQRAFLPLHLVGSSALEEEDMVTLRAAFPAVLMNTTWGLQCLFVEPKWQVTGTSMENVLRALFYLVAAMAEDDRTQVEGVHCIFVISTPRGPEVDWNFFQRVVYLMTQVFPLRLKKFHIVGFPQQRKPSELAGIMQSATNVFGQYVEVWQPILQIHAEHKKKQVMTELLSTGLTTRGLPLFLGGQWSLRDFSQWCRHRMILERSKCFAQQQAISAAPPSVAVSTSNQFSVGVGLPFGSAYIITAASAGFTTSARAPGVVAEDQQARTTAAAALARSFTPSPKPTESEEDKMAKRRMGNLISSRRKRERQRAHIQLLKDELSRLTEENQRLQNEEERLESLLQATEEALATTQNTTHSSPDNGAPS
ncbi:hypothetical protein ACA910_015411 [Epithemia clementina (nom. ined.)]